MEIETNGYYVLNTNGVQQIPINVNIGETGKIQSVKNVDITANGKTNVLPDEGYNGIANVVVNTNVETDVKVQDSKEVTITSNGSTAVVPDSGFAAIKSVFVNTQVPEPESEASKSIDVVENGSYTVTPTSPYNAMKSVTCNVNVPIKNIQPTKTVSITSNGSVNITPDAGYDGIGTVSANVNVSTSGSSNIVIIKCLYAHKSDVSMHVFSDEVVVNDKQYLSFSSNGLIIFTTINTKAIHIQYLETSTRLTDIDKYVFIPCSLDSQFGFFDNSRRVFAYWIPDRIGYKEGGTGNVFIDSDSYIKFDSLS